MGLFDKLFKRNKEQQEQKEALDQGLQKTKEGFFSKIAKAIVGKDTVDEEVLDQVEDALISADVGVDTTVAIIDRIEKRV
jgi:fused signal recognition particle receptor